MTIKYSVNAGIHPSLNHQKVILSNFSLVSALLIVQFFLYPEGAQVYLERERWRRNGRRRQMCLTSEIIRYSTICLFGVCIISFLSFSHTHCTIESLFRWLSHCCWLVSYFFCSFFQVLLLPRFIAVNLFAQSLLLYFPNSGFLLTLIMQTSFHCVIGGFTYAQTRRQSSRGSPFAPHVLDKS